MIDGLRPYPATRDSGVTWLRHVPAHWEVRPLKRAVRRIVGGSTPSSATADLWDGDVVWVTPADISRAERLTPSQRKITRRGLETASTELVPPGSIVVTSRAPVGNVAVADVELCTNQGCQALVLSDDIMMSAFGFALLQTLKPELQSLARGTTFTEISGNKLGEVVVPVPPRKEQAAIAAFIGHIDRRIRCFIGANQRLIQLLIEQNQSVIHRAVTRGLDPDVRLKHSGIPWLGDIPTHWELVRSKRLFSARRNLALPEDVQLSSTQAYGVIPQSEFEAKVGRRVVRISMHLEQRRHVERDDFVISMRSFQGGLERAWASGAIRSSYVVLKPASSVDAGFFTYLFKSQGYIRALQSTADFIRDGQDLNFGNFCRVDLPLVPLEEQKSIAAFIATTTVGIETTIARTKREIALMQEYRARLTADIVTGKLDVREAAARLPEAVEELQPLDRGATTDAEEDMADDLDNAPEEEATA